MTRTSLRTLTAVVAAVLTACMPWRSDIELTRGVAAAPILEVRGWQAPIYPSGPRHVAYGPWTADRHRSSDDAWSVIVRHDSSLTGAAWCWADTGPVDQRRKGGWREVPQEDLTCDLLLAGASDTLHLQVKADVGHPLNGRAANEDWALTLRGTDRLRTRSCLVLSNCGWYVNLDGMDIAAVEADARAWVYIAPDLGEEVRGLAAVIAGVLLLREDPAMATHRQPLASPMGY